MDLDALLIESPHVQQEFWKLNEHLRHAELALQLAVKDIAAGRPEAEVTEEYHVSAAGMIAA